MSCFLDSKVCLLSLSWFFREIYLIPRNGGNNHLFSRNPSKCSRFSFFSVHVLFLPFQLAYIFFKTELSCFFLPRPFGLHFLWYTRISWKCWWKNLLFYQQIQENHVFSWNFLVFTWILLFWLKNNTIFIQNFTKYLYIKENADKKNVR